MVFPGQILVDFERKGFLAYLGTKRPEKQQQREHNNSLYLGSTTT